MISERTRLALAEAKRRGVRLGSNGSVLAARHRQQAIDRAVDLAPIVQPLIEQQQSYSEIARHLNSLGVPTANGGRFYPETVKNVVQRLQRVPIDGVNQ